MTFDLIIIGSGPAGLTAGMYAGRNGYSAVVLESESVGGELVNRDHVDDYPGFPDGIAGTDLRRRLVKQARAYDIDIRLATVEAVSSPSPFEVETRDAALVGETVVVATGGRPEPLGVPGESTFVGRGVFDCAKCDGPLYADERIAVVGGGDRALVDALYLSDVANEVFVIDSEPELSAAAVYRERVASDPAITVYRNAKVTALDGDETLQRVTMEREGGERTDLEVAGITAKTRVVPHTEFLEDALLNDRGKVVVDEGLKTDVTGLYAAGDVRRGSGHKIASAVGDGATVFASMRSFLETR